MFRGSCLTSTGLLLLAAVSLIAAQATPSNNPNALLKKIQDELSGSVLEDGQPNPKIPHGEFLHGVITNSKIYPGTENEFQVYVPAQYDPATPACLLLKLDGMGNYEATVLDNLIAKKELPIIIGVGLTPGTIWKDAAGLPNRQALRFNRSYEFDSVNDHFPDFVLNELLPAVGKLKTPDGRAVNLSPNGNDHAAMGASTGGIGSFTLAWRRPDQFSRVYSEIGTFVSMRGGHDYPALIRKTDPLAIRIFLEDGSADAWNPLFGSWFDANLNMESALRFAGYDVAHAWGNHGHDGHPGQVILPDVLRWLWRDYPASLKAGVSQNSTLQEITYPGEGWQKITRRFQDVAGLTSNQAGDVYVSDPSAAAIYRIDTDGKAIVFSNQSKVAAEAFGPDGLLYAAVPGERKIVSIDPQGRSRTVVPTINAAEILMTHDGTLFASESGAHSDMPSRIWRINAGVKKLAEEGLLSASGIAFSPDGALFYAAEKSTQWIYSFTVGSGGSLQNKQPFYWLHATDIPNNSGTQALAVDMHGNLYAATRIGIQVCDPNGRVRAILPLPSPGGSVRALCFGGPHFDALYASDGTHVFRRQLKVPGVPAWSALVPVRSQGPG